MQWSNILQNKLTPVVCGLLAVTCIFPPWQNGADISPSISAYRFILQPPSDSQGIAWSALLCEWALILFTVVGLSKNWKKFAAGAFGAMVLSVAIYFVATLYGIATQPQTTVSATRQKSEGTAQPDRTKDDTDLFDEAAKLMAK